MASAVTKQICQIHRTNNRQLPDRSTTKIETQDLGVQEKWIYQTCCQTIMECLNEHQMSWLSEQNSNHTLLFEMFHSKKPGICNYGPNRLIFLGAMDRTTRNEVLLNRVPFERCKVFQFDTLSTANKKSMLIQQL